MKLIRKSIYSSTFFVLFKQLSSFGHFMKQPCKIFGFIEYLIKASKFNLNLILEEDTF